MYNEKTSAMYTDLSLNTADQEIGKEAAEVFAALLKGETLEHTGNLLSDPGGKRLYREYHCCKYRRTFSGAFQNIPVRHKRTGKSIYCLCRFYDQKYGSPCGSGCSDL